MASRIELHQKLCSLLGSKNVYFQPPETLKMSYPCIVYELDSVDIANADNINYRFTKAYSITIIDKDPDSKFVEDIIEMFPMIRFDRAYINSNLNHFVYRIYY